MTATLGPLDHPGGPHVRYMTRTLSSGGALMHGALPRCWRGCWCCLVGASPVGSGRWTGGPGLVAALAERVRPAGTQARS